MAILTAVIGTIAACLYPMDNITDFLYLIGSVFAPMIAIQIADFFLLKKKEIRLDLDITKIIIWIVGFIIYRLLMQIDLPVGTGMSEFERRLRDVAWWAYRDALEEMGAENAKERADREGWVSIEDVKKKYGI